MVEGLGEKVKRLNKEKKTLFDADHCMITRENQGVGIEVEEVKDGEVKG